MKKINLKIMYGVVLAVLFGAATLISSQSHSAVLAFEKKGSDQDVGDKQCEAKHTEESSTFGKCKNVCGGKAVTWDAVGRRYTCDAPKPAPNVKPATIKRQPAGNATLTAFPGSNPKPPAPSVNNAGKTKQ
jgi:hypothetical protein